MDVELILGVSESISDVASNVFHSSWFAVFKFFAGIYALVLFVDIILLLVLRGVRANIRVGLRGAEVPVRFKGKFMKKWSEIMKRMESGSVSHYKAAILEADSVVDEILEKIGYSGKNMTERLEAVNEIQIENIEDLKKAHEIRNKIIHDKNFEIDLEEAKEIISIYETFLKEIELL
jgi:hypothetical protein